MNLNSYLIIFILTFSQVAANSYVENFSDVVNEIYNSQNLSAPPILLKANSGMEVVVWSIHDGKTATVYVGNYDSNTREYSEHILFVKENSEKVVLQAAISPGGKAAVGWRPYSHVSIFSQGLYVSIYDREWSPYEEVLPRTQEAYKPRKYSRTTMAINDNGQIAILNARREKNGGTCPEVISFDGEKWSVQAVRSHNADFNAVIAIDPCGNAIFAKEYADNDAYDIIFFYRRGIDGPWRNLRIDHWFRVPSFESQRDSLCPLEFPKIPVSIAFDISSNKIIHLTTLENRSFGGEGLVNEETVSLQINEGK